MTDRQKLFVDAYFAEARGNATHAARVAGYEEPNKQGWRVKNEPDVRAEIEKRLAQNAMAANEVLWRVSSIARASLADAFEVQEIRKSVFPVISYQQIFETGLIHAIKKFKRNEFGPEIELQDSIAALKLLMQHHGLLKPSEATSDEDALTILRKALGIDNASNQPPGDGLPPVEVETPLGGSGTVD